MAARAQRVALVAALVPTLVACPSSPFPEQRVELTKPATAPASSPQVQEKLRFSVAAMQSPQDTFAGYSTMLERLGAALGLEIELVQRRTYQEVNDLLGAGKVDAAILCTGGYFDLERRFPGAVEVLAVPVAHGESTYRSYLIVPASSRDDSLAHLKGKRFAYTDELSLSGRLYVLHRLRKSGQNGSFFGTIQFTGSHDRSIEAVARHVVDGAAVDSLVFDQLVASRPELRSAVRIIERSPPFGAAPLVAARRLPDARRDALRTAVLSLHEDPAGAAALRLIGLERWAAPGPRHFESAAAVVRTAR